MGVGGWGGGVGGIECAMSWCDLNLTFALAFVTLSLRTFRPGYISEIIRCRNLKFGGGGGGGGD